MEIERDAKEEEKEEAERGLPMSLLIKTTLQPYLSLSNSYDPISEYQHIGDGDFAI